MPTSATPITVTVDIEDHRPDDSWPNRVPTLTEQVLAWLEERSIRATFFVVGSVGAANPDVVRSIAAAGHEIGLHNWDHVHITTQTVDDFRDGVRRGKALLEELGGRTVAGFRAPTASIVPETMWCTDVLHEEGFTYSSSIVPGWNPLFSFPGAPRNTPLRWPSGLLEIGQYSMGPAPSTLPFGGIYLRLLPWSAVRLALRVSPPHRGACVYFHPYDFDLEEPSWKVPDAGIASPLHFRGRRGFLDKLDRVVRTVGTAAPLGEIAATIEDPQRFDPPLSRGVTRLRVDGRRAGAPA